MPEPKTSLDTPNKVPEPQTTLDTPKEPVSEATLDTPQEVPEVTLNARQKVPEPKAQLPLKSKAPPCATEAKQPVQSKARPRPPSIPPPQHLQAPRPMAGRGVVVPPPAKRARPCGVAEALENLDLAIHPIVIYNKSCYNIPGATSACEAADGTGGRECYTRKLISASSLLATRRKLQQGLPGPHSEILGSSFQSTGQWFQDAFQLFIFSCCCSRG